MFTIQNSYSNLKNFASKITIKNPAQYFLVTAFVFGMLMILITPAFQGPDENIHYLRVSQIARGNVIPDTKGEMVGGEIDKGTTDLLTKSLDEPDLPFKPDTKIHLDQLKKASKIDSQENKTTFINFGTEAYNPVSYAPSSLSVSFGMLLGMKPFVLFYFARIGSFLFWLIVTYAAIRIIPVKKYTLAISSLLPMLLFQGSVVTSDSVAFAILAIFIAQIVRLRLKSIQPSKLQWCALALTALVLSLTKQPMFLFLPLILLSRTREDASKAKRWVPRSLLALSAFSVLIWNYFVTISFEGNTVNTGGSVPSEQIPYLLHNPLVIFKLTYNTYFTETGDFVYRSFVGVFGWVDTPLPLLIVILSLIATLLSFKTFIRSEDSGKLLTVDSRYKLTLWEKSLVSITMIAFFGAVNLALYVYFTPPELGYFYGVQGRYFLPELYAGLLLTLRPSDRYKEHNNIIQSRLLLISTCVLFFSLITLTYRYYPI